MNDESEKVKGHPVDNYSGRFTLLQFHEKIMDTDKPGLPVSQFATLAWRFGEWRQAANGDTIHTIRVALRVSYGII